MYIHANRCRNGWGDRCDKIFDNRKENSLAVTLELTIYEQTELTTDVSDEVGKDAATDVAIIMETFMTSSANFTKQLTI